MWSARLIAIPLVVVLVWLADLSSGQQDFFAGLNAGTPKGRQELLHLLRSENIPFVVDCLIDPSNKACDRRTVAVRNLVPILSRTNFQCQVCPPAVQQDIDIFKNAIQSNQNECNRLQRSFGLRSLC